MALNGLLMCGVPGGYHQELIFGRTITPLYRYTIPHTSFLYFILLGVVSETLFL